MTDPAEGRQNALRFRTRGVLRPFQRDRKNDFASATGAELRKSRIGQILGTKGGSGREPGEVPWRGDFGSRLYRLRHSNNVETLADRANVFVVEAIRRWDPTILVTSVRVDTSTPRTIVVVVRYSVTDSRGRVVVADEEVRVPLRTAA